MYNIERFKKLGLSDNNRDSHCSRTMMFREIDTLLVYVTDQNVSPDKYEEAIVQDNCLAKRSEQTRKITLGHLINMYSLNSSNLFFRNLRFFWERDIEGRPLLALMSVYLNDSLVRSSAKYIFGLNPGADFHKESVEQVLEEDQPGRLSESTRQSAARNLSSTWSQSGHLTGSRQKTRAQAYPTPGSVSYALLLAYLSGERGENLFRSEFITLLDCSYETAIGLAEIASQKGWITFKQVSNVIEVLFPNLLTTEEMELINE